MQTDLYSRTVSLLKVLFPLAALGILSTLFLLSRGIDSVPDIPFADTEMRERLLNQQVSGPYYSAVSSDGDEITFRAETVTTPGALDGAKNATEVEARFKMASGTVFDVSARTGFFDLAQDQANLAGDVVFISSRGAILRSEKLVGRVSMLDLRSPGPVDGVLPVGTLEAGTMHLTAVERDGPAHLVFQQGVKLVYDPKQRSE